MKVQKNPMTWLLTAIITSSVGCNFYGDNDKSATPEAPQQNNNETIQGNDLDPRAYSLAAIAETAVELQALQVDGLLRNNNVKHMMNSRSNAAGWGEVNRELNATAGSPGGWGGAGNNKDNPENPEELSIQRDCELGGHFTSISNPQLESVPANAFKNDLTPRMNTTQEVAAVSLSFENCRINDNGQEVVINGSLDARSNQASTQYLAGDRRMDLVNGEGSAELSGSISVDTKDGRSSCSIDVSLNISRSEGTVHLTERKGNVSVQMDIAGLLCDEDVDLALDQSVNF